jgi:hypothetical protein
MVRGALTGAQAERVRESVLEFIDELGSSDDADPPPRKDDPLSGPTRDERALRHAPAPGQDAPSAADLPPSWRGVTPVLCVAGRGPLDDAAAAMLAQLLGKHGLGARVVPHAEVARGAIARLDVSGVAMICVSHLDLSSNPSQLRYLLRRLRTRLPAAIPSLVGFLPARDETPEGSTEAPENARLLAAVGADYAAASLREAVQVCVAEAHRAARSGSPAPAIADPMPAPLVARIAPAAG